MTGYTRQSAASMTTGNTIYAADHNAEFNQIQSAFDGISGHSHDGSTGSGPKINLTTSVTGVLPVTSGGTGGINKTDATVDPTATDDFNDGYRVGSIWVNVTSDTVFILVDSTAGAAIWKTYQLLDAGLTSIAGLTTSANQMIYTTALDVYATTALTPFARTFLDDADAGAVRTTLGLGTISTQNSNSVSISGGSITGITDLAIADGGTGASTATNARANLGVNILAGHRNKIINGDFVVAQRATTASVPTTGTFVYPSIDRWALYINGTGGSFTFSQQSFAPGQTTVPGNPLKYGTVACSVAGTGATSNTLTQKVEDVTAFSGKTFTYTMYLRSTISTSFPFSIFNVYGSGGSSTDSAFSNTGPTLTANTWTKVQHVITFPSISGKTVGSNSNIQININMPLAATYTLDIAHVSLVEGDVSSEADPFPPRFIGDEISFCKRYFEVVVAGYGGPTTSGSQYAAVIPIGSKRISPTVSWRAAETVLNFPSTAPTISGPTTNGGLYVSSTANATASAGFAFHALNLDAEL